MHDSWSVYDEDAYRERKGRGRENTLAGEESREPRGIRISMLSLAFFSPQWWSSLIPSSVSLGVWRMVALWGRLSVHFPG